MHVIWYLGDKVPETTKLIEYLQEHYPLRIPSENIDLDVEKKLGRHPPSIILQHLPTRNKSTYQKIDYENTTLVYLCESANYLSLIKDGHFAFKLPTNPVSFVNSIHGILRAMSGQKSFSMSYKDVSLDVESQILSITGIVQISLTNKECRLLNYFLKNTGKILQRKDLKDKVWKGTHVHNRTIDSQVSKLRRTLERSEVDINSIYGEGYILQ